MIRVIPQPEPKPQEKPEPVRPPYKDTRKHG